MRKSELNTLLQLSRPVSNRLIKIVSLIGPESREIICDIKVSPSNTAIIEWESGDTFLSLEVGKNGYGYFLEKDGKDLVQVDLEVDSIKVAEDLKKIIGKHFK